MKRIRLKELAMPRPLARDDGPLARENARLRRGLMEAEKELACAERAAWAGGRTALEPHMRCALSTIRAVLDR